MKLIWSQEALDGLSAIQEYISRDNPHAAEQFIHRLVRRTNLLLEQPRMGRLVPEYDRPDLRELIEGNSRIIYLVQADAVALVSVIEAHRRLPRLRLGPTEEG